MHYLTFRFSLRTLLFYLLYAVQLNFLYHCHYSFGLIFPQPLTLFDSWIHI